MCMHCALPKSGMHIFFMCPTGCFSWIYVHKALGSEWLASDVGDFLNASAHRIGRWMRLFYLVFMMMTYTLWMTHNKMVMEKLLL